MSNGKPKLPPKSNDKVIEISLRHITLAFGGIIITSFSIGAGIALVKDYAKFRRQKAIIEATQQLILTIQTEGVSWKKEKTGSTSPTKISGK